MSAGHSMLETNDPSWLDEPSILFHVDRLAEFVPSSDLSFERKLNAAVRGMLYLGIVLFVTGMPGVSVVTLMLGVAVVCWVISTSMYAEPAEEEDGEGKKTHAGATDVTEGFLSAPAPHISSAAARGKRGRDPTATCTAPTNANPFMNVMVGEHRTAPTRGGACTFRDNKQIKEDVERSFKNNAIFYDVTDVFNRTQSQREYYTTPITTIPNKQHQFATWLYSEAAGRKQKMHPRAV
jgi:hypothetical protein